MIVPTLVGILLTLVVLVVVCFPSRWDGRR